MKRPILIVTPSGTLINVEEPQVHEICINDIAKGLSQIIRFKGDITKRYSVARHSFVVSYLVPPQYALEALLHDAPEAYLGDLISPVKAVCEDYQKLEQVWWEVVAAKWGMADTISETVHTADKLAFVAEAVSLLRQENRPQMLKVLGINPQTALNLLDLEHDYEIPPLTNDYQQFLGRAKELGI
jgi:hypothetical protein